MATLTIPWNDGNGNIILTYNGQGDGTVTVQSSTDNLCEDRQQVITLKTTDGTKAVQVTIAQSTGMLILRDVQLMTLRDSQGKILRAYPNASVIPNE